MTSEMRGTNDAQQSPRGQVAYQESTRDPIFLFQVKRFHFSEKDIESMGDHDGWSYSSDEARWLDAAGEPVSDEAMIEAGFGHAWWDTDCVVATREEGDAKGKARPYEYGEQHKGWRVYCVPCDGDLARILVKHWPLRRVKQAAVRDGDGTVHTLPRPARHNDIIGQRHVRMDEATVQGFLLEDGDFVNRVEAAAVALESGQVKQLNWPPQLYSEDLW